MVYVAQQECAGLYKDWAPPPDERYRPKNKNEAWTNIKMHQFLAQSYSRAREYQELYGVDDDDDESEGDPGSPSFNDSQKEVERYLEFINALPARPPHLTLNSQSTPSKPNLDDTPQLVQHPTAVSSTPTPRRWRRYLSLESAKPPFLSPVKLWKRTTSLPTSLPPIIPFPFPSLPTVHISLKTRASFARFRRAKSAPAQPVEMAKANPDLELRRVSSAPKLNQSTHEGEKKASGASKKKRRATVDDGLTVIARARLKNFSSASTSTPTSTPVTPAPDNSAFTPPSTTPYNARTDSVSHVTPSTPRRKRRSIIADDRRHSIDEGAQGIKFPVEPVPLRSSVISPVGTSSPTSPSAALVPSSPLETTATCPYSIRQRPMPPDEWFGFNVVKPESSPSPSNEIQKEKVTLYDFFYLVFIPILALISFTFVFVLTVPMWFVWVPVDCVFSLCRRVSGAVGEAGDSPHLGRFDLD